MLRFTPIGQNLWAVRRGGVKISEVALTLEGHCTLIPVSSYALTLDEMQLITDFMREAYSKDSAIVLGPALRPAIPHY